MHLLGITSAGRLAAVCIAAGALSAPLAYLLGRELGGEQRGRLAGVLMIFSPAAVLFGVTSVDTIFAALGTAIAWLLVSPRVGRRGLGCALVAVASFFSWVLLAIPAWAVLVTLRREGCGPPPCSPPAPSRACCAHGRARPCSTTTRWPSCAPSRASTATAPRPTGLTCSGCSARPPRG